MQAPPPPQQILGTTVQNLDALNLRSPDTVFSKCTYRNMCT